MTIKFIVKDDGNSSLIRAISEILSQSAPVSTYAAGGFIIRCTIKQKILKGILAMNIRFSANSAGRRALANAIGEILEENVIYNGTPTFSYSIGDYIIDRDGAIICPDSVSREKTNHLITTLAERGYETEYVPAPVENDKLVVEMPREQFTDAVIANLKKIIASKETLLKKALGIDRLWIDITDDKLCFPWFTLAGTDGEVDAYTRFIRALCDMAKRQKHVTAKEKPLENDKFTMRVFLIRLGFNGPEFKNLRKILMKNLTGNNAFKYGKPESSEEAITTAPLVDLVCLNCRYEFSGTVNHDEFGRYGSCPKCSSSFEA